MIRLFRDFKAFNDYCRDIRARLDILLAQRAPDLRDSLVALNRHQLGSIDLQDFKTRTEEEQEAYDAQVAAAFPVLERDISEMIQAQLEFIGQEALSWEQTLVDRGTINGLSLLLERWTAAKNRHVVKNRQPDPFNEHNPLPEIHQ